MPTKYDVFAELIEHAPCKASDLSFNNPIYNHLSSLIDDGVIKKENNQYLPIKNTYSENLFKIIKYCLKNGLDYNLILSKNTPEIIIELFNSVPVLRPKNLIGNQENTKILKYLEENQFILLTSKTPREGIILKHQLFENILKLKKISKKLKTNKYLDLKKNILKIKTNLINPFDNDVFEFLSGSAQLEGSTITIGETKEMIVNDIYPDKPKKDIQMVKNLNEALHYMLDHLDEDITEEHIREINRMVLFSLHRNAGNYKITDNKIQGNPNFKTAPYKKVPELLKNYCIELNKINSKEKCLDKLGYIHNELQFIHPFSDGNSRTTRMILNWMLLKNKLPFFVIKMGCFDEYMSLTKLSLKRDDDKLNELFHHILYHEFLIN